MLPQPGVLSNAIPVTVITLFVPAAVSKGKVKVPVPGEPDVNDICAVVEARVFVPEML